MRWLIRTLVVALVLSVLAALPMVSVAQLPARSDDGSRASWIAHPEAPADQFGVFHFRRVLELESVPDSYVVHVSADNRYKLLVNEVAVSSGPQRSDLAHWRYETVDLAPFLQPGSNVLAATVWNWGDSRPIAQFSHRTAFLMQGRSDAEGAVDTGPAWKVFQHPGYRPLPVNGRDVGGYYASPPGESLDSSLNPWGWESPDFDDSSWLAATAVEATGWQLTARSIPPMEETPTRFATVRRAEGVEADDRFLQGAGDLVVPPMSRAVLLLDQSHLTNAYPVLEASGGAGSRVALIYAEALKDAQGNKGNRNDIEGKTISGVRDEFVLDGGEGRRFETLWYRTYRYVQLEIETQDEALRIHDLHGVFTGYPFELAASFSSDLPWLADMWEINWRGARLCARETYFDTPYYEQLQYIGDTRIQALITLYMSDDDRLVRQAIDHFALSRIPEGITTSRYPSAQQQLIPTFSLIWIAMIHDYWMHRDDPDYVRQFLPGVRGVLGWFERRVDGSGLLGPIPEWPYIDWARGWRRGMPPGASEGGSVVITLQYVYALERAAEMEAAVGNTEVAARHRTIADFLKRRVRELALDPATGLFSDTPGGDSFSQHANVLAILTDTVPDDEKATLMESLLDDESLTQSTYYFSFYLLEALREAGLGDRYIELLGPWQEMLALGLTTVPETPEPTRSDSHAWSAHPNYGLLATVLGVRPAEPGFRSVRIEPKLGELQRAEGRIPHPLGDIDVTLQRTADDGLHAEVTLPAGLDGVLIWGGQQIELLAGQQNIEL